MSDDQNCLGAVMLIFVRTGIGITVAHGHDALGSQRSLTGLDKLFETMTGKRAASARKLKQGPESTNSSQHNAPKPLHGPRSNTKAGPATDAGDDSDDSAGRAAMITNGAKPGRKRGRSGAAKSPNQNAAGCSSGEEVGGHESASGKDGRHPTKKRRAGVAGSYLDQVLAEKGSSRKKGKKP